MLTERKKFTPKGIINAIGVPTLIIAAFFAVILILANMYDLSVVTLLSDTVKRAGMNGLLVLAMLPSIQSGTGPNFALPIGVECGLFAMVLAIEWGFTGWGWFGASVGMAIVFAILVGWAYGKLLNAVKGSEMTIATYAGFAICSFMCIFWLMLPFKSPNMGWFIGQGLRETIQLDAVDAAMLLNNFGGFWIGEEFYVPTGMLLFFFLCCFLVWLFFRSKAGIAISAVGSSNAFAEASGLNVNKNRVLANIVSTILGAIGIIIFSQSYGYLQIYTAHLNIAFAAVAGILIGGATASRAKVSHVIIGVFLYQGLLTSALPVANQIFAGTDLSEVLRMIIQNGFILYALTQVKKGGK